MCTHPVWPAPSLLSPGGDPLRGLFSIYRPGFLVLFGLTLGESLIRERPPTWLPRDVL